MGKLCGFVYLLFRTSTRAAIYVSIIFGNSSKAYEQGIVIVWFVAFIINSLAAVAICKMLYNTVKHTRGRIENHDTTAEEMAKHEVGEFWFLLFLWLNFKSRCTFRNRAHAHAPHTFSRYAACRTNDELPEDRGFETLEHYSFSFPTERSAERAELRQIQRQVQIVGTAEHVLFVCGRECVCVCVGRAKIPTYTSKELNKSKCCALRK